MIIASIPLNHLVRVFIHPQVRRRHRDLVSKLAERFVKVEYEWERFVSSLTPHELAWVCVPAYAEGDWRIPTQQDVMEVGVEESSSSLPLFSDSASSHDHFPSTRIFIHPDMSLDEITHLMTVAATPLYLRLRQGILSECVSNTKKLVGLAKVFQTPWGDDMRSLEDRIRGDSDALRVRETIEKEVAMLLQAESARVVPFGDLLRRHSGRNWVIPVHHLSESDVYLTVLGAGVTKESITPECAARVLAVTDMYARYLERTKDKAIAPAEGGASIWDQAFSLLEWPVAMLTSKGDVVLHNLPFGRLSVSPVACLEFRDRDTVHLQGKAYRVSRVEMVGPQQDVILFSFLPADTPSQEWHISSDELGIITSSIAHELNNPVAGVLAAMTVLELEATNDHQVETLISEMKKGARRCKDLIETFLGFSRARSDGQHPVPIHEALTQAINLIRFRCMESGLEIELDASRARMTTQWLVRRPVMAMMFYLVMGQLMTSYAHRGLIADETHGGRRIYLVWSEAEEGMAFTVRPSFEFMDAIEQNRLIRHLLAQEQLDMRSDGHERMILTRRNVMAL